MEHTKGRIQPRDYYVIQLNVNKYPKATIQIDDATGEEHLLLISEVNPIKIQIHALVDPQGQLVLPATQYLYYLKKKQNCKDTSSIAQALLMYFRFLHNERVQFNDFPENEDDRPTYKFAQYLLELVAGIPIERKNKQVHAQIKLSTAKARMRAIISWYRYMHNNGMVNSSSLDKAFTVIDIKLKSSRQNNNKHILSHTLVRRQKVHREHNYERTVQSTDIMRRFPPSQSYEPHEKLKALTASHKDLFVSQLTNIPTEKKLMYRLGYECGLRLNEFCTFPASEVKRPVSSDHIPIYIGPLTNGCMTKFSKEGGMVRVPASLMLEMYDYLHSHQRQKLEKKGESNGRLFLNRQGRPFNPNTIQTHFSALRNHMQSIDPSWFYRLHDLRSTFASDTLERMMEESGYSVSNAISELRLLMRHENISDTIKYITFYQSRNVRRQHGRDLNELARRAQEKHG
ncbi:hypothetical protein CGG88_12000 [Vibrio parahaemolyticus]|uniref:site-specific integrase n=1 Tax=Vibrio parahaemolyticus TaxID=670 RepID=UPI00112437C1|nr:site-specific integrase [Vibrio parahaemolyticus]TOQ81084.1 hypothetical protein CGG88_12000 [Vibrio parahaemolyticus]